MNDFNTVLYWEWHPCLFWFQMTDLLCQRGFKQRSKSGLHSVLSERFCHLPLTYTYIVGCIMSWSTLRLDRTFPFPPNSNQPGLLYLFSAQAGRARAKVSLQRGGSRVEVTFEEVITMNGGIRMGWFILPWKSYLKVQVEDLRNKKNKPALNGGKMGWIFPTWKILKVWKEWDQSEILMWLWIQAFKHRVKENDLKKQQVGLLLFGFNDIFLRFHGSNNSNQ